MRVEGWERIYPATGEATSKPTSHEKERSPLIYEWENIVGDRLSVERLHYYVSEEGKLRETYQKGFKPFYPSQSELGVGQKKWLVSYPDGSEEYFATRVEAQGVAREFMTNFYTEKKLASHYRERENVKSSLVPKVFGDDCSGLA